MDNFKIRSVVLLTALLSASTCFADHLPPKDQSKGLPEKTLAGITLDHTKVSDVIRKYGNPSEVQKEKNPPDSNVVDTYHYRWHKRGIKLHLAVFHFDETRNGEDIAVIEIEGSRPTDRIYQTGRGLKIGDDLADVRRIYGPRYKLSNIPSLSIHNVEIQWRSEEYSLIAELDKKGRITKLSLFSPE